MSGPGHGEDSSFRFGRILMALDATSEVPWAVDVIAALAARLDADLRGLFVEDEDLLKLAEHRDLSAFSLVKATREPLDSGVVTRALRLQVQSSRRAIEEAARRHRVASTFEVRRGRVAEVVMESAAGTDLVVVGWTSGGVPTRPGNPWTRPGAVARAVAAGAARSVLLLRKGGRLDGPILVAYDGSAGSGHALEAAALLSGQGMGVLEVVLIESNLDRCSLWRTEIASWLASRRVRTEFLHLASPDVARLTRAAHRHHAAILVAGADLLFVEGETDSGLLEQVDCSLLLVR